jgi:hypothetical protein
MLSNNNKNQSKVGKPNSNKKTNNKQKQTSFSQNRVQAPVSYGNIQKIGKPRITTSSNGDTRIVHKEYLGEVTGQTAFTSTTYRIQPGSFKTFPWLAAVANRYEKYRFNRLRFCYETDCATTVAGTVMLIPDYDSSDPAPVSKIQALTYQDSARGQAWTPFCFDASKENLKALPQYNVVSGQPPPGTDIKFYQVGNMFLCVSGFSGSLVVGELWVEYDITLMAPDTGSPPVSAIITATGGSTAAGPIGTTYTVVGSLDITVLSSSTFTFNQVYQGLISWEVGGTVITGMAITSSGISKAAVNTLLINATATAGFSGLAVNAVPGDIITIATTATTITLCQITISSGDYVNVL